jgi:hypothetical protein
MMRLVAILLIIICVCGTARAQDSTRYERIAYVVGASVGFSLVDYVAFNYAQAYLGVDHRNFTNTIYHGLFGLLGVAINYFLFEKFGWKGLAGFDLIWWTWGDDLGYMAWANILNPPSPHWPNRSTEQFTDNICCAEWTPAGLMQGYRGGLPRSTLFGQAAIGFAISMGILW